MADSAEFGAMAVGDAGRGVMSMDRGMFGTASAIDGDKGSISFLSLIEITIFSKPREVICFSLPLLRLSSELGLGPWMLISTAPISNLRWPSIRSASSDANESTLADNSGTSFDPGPGLETSIGGVVVNCGCDSQQRVSRPQILQLRFSNLRPSSIDSAHRENTVKKTSKLVDSDMPRGAVNLTSPHAEEVLHVAGVDLVHFTGVDGQHGSCQSCRHDVRALAMSAYEGGIAV